MKVEAALRRCALAAALALGLAACGGGSEDEVGDADNAGAEADAGTAEALAASGTAPGGLYVGYYAENPAQISANWLRNRGMFGRAARSDRASMAATR